MIRSMTCRLISWFFFRTPGTIGESESQKLFRYSKFVAWRGTKISIKEVPNYTKMNLNPHFIFRKLVAWWILIPPLRGWHSTGGQTCLHRGWSRVWCWCRSQGRTDIIKLDMYIYIFYTHIYIYMYIWYVVLYRYSHNCNPIAEVHLFLNSLFVFLGLYIYISW